MTAFEWLFLASGSFGLPYLLVVSTVYIGLLIGCRGFKARIGDAVALTLPIALYLVLLLGRNRQGLNAGYANVVVAAIVCVMLPFKLRAWWSQGRQTAAIALLGCSASALSWLAMPFAPYMKFEIW